MNLPGESGQLGINEDLFFSGADEVENSGVVDLRRNDGLSNRYNNDVNDVAGKIDINSNRNDKDEKRRNRKTKSKNRSDSDDDDDDDNDNNDDDDLDEIIEREKAISDAAYIAGNEQKLLTICQDFCGYYKPHMYLSLLSIYC